MKQFISIVFFLSALVSHAALAQQVSAQVGMGDVYNNGQHSNETLAEVWDLKVEEIERYQRLLIVDRHYSSSSITPYELLGKHAQSYEEGQRYAKRVVEKNLEQYRKSMEWAITVGQSVESNAKMAMEMISESELIRNHLAQKGIPTSAYMGRMQDEMLGIDRSSDAYAKSQEPKPRVRLFVDADACGDTCIDLWDRVRAKQTLQQYSGIDVVFVGDRAARPSKETVSLWAQARKITTAEVDRKHITLNFESKRFAAIRNGKQAPIAIESTGSIFK